METANVSLVTVAPPVRAIVQMNAHIRGNASKGLASAWQDFSALIVLSKGAAMVTARVTIPVFACVILDGLVMIALCASCVQIQLVRGTAHAVTEYVHVFQASQVLLVHCLRVAATHLVDQKVLAMEQQPNVIVRLDSLVHNASLKYNHARMLAAAKVSASMVIACVERVGLERTAVSHSLRPVRRLPKKAKKKMVSSQPKLHQKWPSLEREVVVPVVLLAKLRLPLRQKMQVMLQ